MRLAWKKPTSTGQKIPINGTRNGREEGRLPKGMKKMRGTSSTSSSRSLTVTTPCTYSPPTSNLTGYTAWAPSVSMSLSISMSSSHHNASLLKKRESSLTGSLPASPMTLHTPQCTTTPEPRRTGESQLSSNTTMTCTIKLLPWLQSRGAWPLPSRPLRPNWTRASDAYSALTHTSGTNYSMPSMRALTSTPSPRGSSPLSLEAHTVVWLNPDWRVMSQGSLQKGKRTTGMEG